MLLAAALYLSSIQGLPKAKEFMPLVLGTRMSYRETGEDSQIYVHEVQESVKVSGQEAIPIVVRSKGNPLSTTYYVFTDNTAAIIAEDDLRAPYSPTRTLFKVGSSMETWTYNGKVPFDAGEAPITMSGSSHLGEKRTVLGKEVETLEVTLDATMTPPKKKPYIQHQEAVYGRGIGLIEMSATQSFNGEKHVQHLELIKITPPGTSKE